MIAFFILLSSIMTLTAIIYFYKYKQCLRVLEDICKYNKIGFKEAHYLYTDYIIEYEELERFKNGYSRVKLKSYNIMTTSSSTFESTEKEIKGYFNDLVKTDSIEWLERVEDLMDVRKKKLERLIK